MLRTETFEYDSGSSDLENPSHCSTAPHSPFKNEGELASFVGLRGTTQVSCDENNYIFTSRQPLEADLRIVGWKYMNIPCS